MSSRVGHPAYDISCSLHYIILFLIWVYNAAQSVIWSIWISSKQQPIFTREDNLRTSKNNFVCHYYLLFLISLEVYLAYIQQIISVTPIRTYETLLFSHSQLICKKPGPVRVQLPGYFTCMYLLIFHKSSSYAQHL